MALPALAALLVAVAAPAFALDPTPPRTFEKAVVPPPALPGIWRVDWAKSDARPRVDGSWIPVSAPGPGPGVRDESGGARAGRRRAVPSRADSDPTLPYAAQTLIIFQRGAHLEISEDGRAAQPVDLGAIAATASAPFRPTIREGHWEDPNLILTRSLAGGGTMTQTYTLAENGTVLELSARIQRAMDEAPLLIHRVYNKFRG